MGKLLIGAGLALLGGVIGGVIVAVYQEWRTEKLTTRLRRAERRDEAMLRLSSLVAPIETILSRMIEGDERLGSSPGIWPGDDAILMAAFETFQSSWVGELSAVIRDEETVTRCGMIRFDYNSLFDREFDDIGSVTTFIREDEARDLLVNVKSLRAFARRAFG
ncbi:MAG: hypothetical protein M3P11_06945 [Actinomycetota bacterium]|nr:hypothetical protein [Actinomycetota bacterium]